MDAWDKRWWVTLILMAVPLYAIFKFVGYVLAANRKIREIEEFKVKKKWSRRGGR